MDFEFDPRKSSANKAKHGIDFVDARALWDDPDRLEIPARTHPEPRVMIIGRIGALCWTAIATHRAGRVRIISVRRSRKEEVRLYEREEDE